MMSTFCKAANAATPSRLFLKRVLALVTCPWQPLFVAVAVVAVAGVVVDAWMGADLNSILPEPREDVVAIMEDFFPMEIKDFFANHYDTDMVLLKHQDTQWNPDKMWNVSDFGQVFEAFARAGKVGGEIAVHPARDENGHRRKKIKLDETSTFKDVQDLFQNGASFVFRYEQLPEEIRPMFELEKALTGTSGIPTSIHLYVSAPGAKVLDPHTDPYDVMVFQIQGTKNWTACVPVAELASLKYNLRRSDITQAQLCMLQELMIGKIEGCNVYSAEDTEDLRCINFQMSRGDVLYMPKGIVHYALTNDESFHLTVGFHRQNMQWFDVLMDVVEFLDPTIGTTFIAHFSQTAEGVHLQETVQGWLLQCFGRHPCDERKEREYFAQLEVLYLQHLSSFGEWLWNLGPAGALELELDPFTLRAHVALLEQMANNRTAIFKAFSKTATVRKYKDTLGHRHKPSDKYSVRRFGEDRPVGTKPSLCDRTSGWSIECKSSTLETCVAFVAPKPKANCAAYCESQGLVCTGGYDDSKDSCVPANPNEARGVSGTGLGCQREMFSMICECSLHSNGTQLPPKPLAVSTKGSAPMAELGGDNMWIVPVQGVTGKLTLAPPASTRSRGRDQPAVGGVPTLCDRVNGWVYECAGSNSSICYGFFGLPRRTCTDWCSDAGLICIAGADDNTRTTCVASTRSRPSCDRALGSHLCVCVTPSFKIGIGADEGPQVDRVNNSKPDASLQRELDVGIKNKSSFNVENHSVSRSALLSHEPFLVKSPSKDDSILHNRISGWQHVCNLSLHPELAATLKAGDTLAYTESSWDVCEVQVEAPATPFSAKDHCANYCNNQGLISTAAWLADPQQRCSPLVSSKVTRPTTAFICRCEVDNAFRWFSGL